VGDDGALHQLTKEQIHDLLGKGWLTHDGMWFLHAAEDLGVETANSLNKKAIRSLADVEMGRMRRAMGVADGPVALEDAVALARDGLMVTMPDSVAAGFELRTEPGRMTWEWEEDRCFAYKGMARAGLLEGYECGVLFRLACWLDVLGADNEFDPPIGKCLMVDDGECRGEVRLGGGEVT